MTVAPVLRLATVDDVPALLDLVRTAFEEYRDWLEPPSGAHSETEASLRGYLTREEAVIAELDDRPVACAFFLAQGDHMDMDRLAVAPAHRRHGLGRVICAYLSAHPEEMQRYVALRRQLAARFSHDILGYNDGKRARIGEIDAKAAAWRAR